MALTKRSLQSRQLFNRLTQVLSTLSAMVGLIFLFWIIYVVVLHGASALNLAFFTKLPTPPMVKGGGLLNAILGTGVITLLATLIGASLGLLGGVFLAEFGRGTKTAGVIRFITNTLIGVPSIIVGVFVYTFMVAPMKTFSGYAGVVALAIIMLPVVVRTTEDILNMVPNSMRESGLALGVPRWRVTFGIVFRNAKQGLLTGVMLAVARISGETAPLLFTALNSPYHIRSLGQPTANLTVTIFNYAMSPYQEWQSKAWGASLLIMAGVLILTMISRAALSVKRINK